MSRRLISWARAALRAFLRSWRTAEKHEWEREFVLQVHCDKSGVFWAGFPLDRVRGPYLLFDRIFETVRSVAVRDEEYRA